MTATRTSSQRGRAARTKGAVAERAVAGWLREHGWPHAERGRSNGFRTVDRQDADGYDITGTPCLLIDVKDQAEREHYLIPTWLAKVTGDADDRNDGTLGLLVVKRAGQADPARWWAFLAWSTFTEAIGAGPFVLSDWPVRMELAHLAPILRAGGWGDPIDATEEGLPE